MTREEAISELRGILTEATEFENSVCYVTEKDAEPLEMAIRALEREQQFLDAGYKNGRVEFYIGGRKFMVKELAQ